MNEKISFDFQSAAAFNATSRSVCYRLLHAFRRGTRANQRSSDAGSLEKGKAEFPDEPGTFGIN